MLSVNVNAYAFKDNNIQVVQIPKEHLEQLKKRKANTNSCVSGLIDDEIRLLGGCLKCKSGFKMRVDREIPNRTIKESPFAIDNLNLTDVIPTAAMKVLLKQVVFLTEKAFEANGQMVFASRTQAIFSSGVIDMFRDPYLLGTYLGVSWDKESFPLREWQEKMIQRFLVFTKEMELYLKVTPNLTSTQKKCEEIIMDFRYQPNFNNLYYFLRFMFTQANPAEHAIDSFIDKRLKHCKSLEQFLSVEYQERMLPIITAALKMQMKSEYKLNKNVRIDDNLNIIFE